jgi:4-amino-4-deoxy-L-arabinose transferase-like glycosyltransferase
LNVLKTFNGLKVRSNYFDNVNAIQLFGIAFLIAALAGMAASVLSKQIIGGEGHDGYLELATNLAAGNGYVFYPDGHKVFHRPPLYPVLLVPGALLPRMLRYAYIIALNSALFAGTVALLFRFARQTFNQRIALGAAAILIANPFLLFGVKNPVSAICQMFLYALVITITWRIAGEPRVPALKIAGFTLALWLAVMSHAVMLPISCVILLGLAASSLLTKRGPTLIQILATASCLALLILPWTIRNYRVTGMFIPVAGNSGMIYFAGNAHWGITQPPARPGEAREDAEFRHAGLPVEKRRQLRSYYGLTDPAAEKSVNERAHEHALTHPGDFAKKFVLNAVEFYFPVIIAILPPQGGVLDGLPLAQRIKSSHSEFLPISLYHLVLVLSAIAGLLKLRRTDRPLALFLFGAWFFSSVLYFPFLTFVGHSLFTYGTLPIISLLAAIAWWSKPTST